MASGIYVAMGAARMQEQRMDTLSNNLANAQTAGFKKHGAIYRQVHNDASKMGDPNQAMDMHHPARFLPEDRLPGQLDERFTHWSDGALRSTGNPLDVAIQGEGFFVVQGPNGDPIYTRNGTFRIQPDGGLVNQQGFALLDPNGQPVRVPPDEGALTISPEGDLTVGEQAVGRLAVVRFADLRQLDRMGNDSFRPADPAVLPEPLDLPQLHQGYLEGANVNPVQTMTQLIKTSRLFEMSTRALQAYKAMDDAAARQVGRTN